MSNRPDSAVSSMQDGSGLVGALQFLTRIPLRTRRPSDLSGSAVWFPVVGALIGAAVGGVAAGLGELTTPAVAAAVAVVVGMLVTGAFHEDGLADLADAVAGGWTRERRLEILQDPRHGTYGVAALIGSVLVRWSALAALVAVGPRAAVLGAVAAHALGRAIAVGTMGLGRLAGPAGLGADYIRAVGPRRALVGLGLGLAVAAAVAGRWTPFVAGVALVASTLVVIVARRGLGGITGDVLGAIEQVTEAATLVTLTACWA